MRNPRPQTIPRTSVVSPQTSWIGDTMYWMYEKRKLHFREIEVTWKPWLHLSWIEERKESKALTMEYKMRAICRKQWYQVARDERRTDLGRLPVPRTCGQKTKAIETKKSMHLHLPLRNAMLQEDVTSKKKMQKAMTRERLQNCRIYNAHNSRHIEKGVLLIGRTVAWERDGKRWRTCTSDQCTGTKGKRKFSWRPQHSWLLELYKQTRTQKECRDCKR